MSEEKKEGLEKKCGKCGLDLICVKIEKEWKGKKEVKLQWQTKSLKRAHFKFAGEKDGKTLYDCMTPEQVVQESMEKPKVETNEDMKICAESPFTEAELIVRWAATRAHKITYEDYTDINSISVETKRGLGQKEGMLTRLLTDTTLDLMKQAGIKVEYDKK